MMLNLLRRAMKVTGKQYLVPFLDGLVHLGRPSQVPFPVELLEQGLAMLLSGLSNTVAMQSNPDWVWPHWVERQIAPDGDAFIPTGFNLIKTNLTQRNWTSIGLEDSSNEGMVDSVGMLTLRPFGWSLFPYLRGQNQSFIPPRMHGRVSQSLLEGKLPVLTTRYRSLENLRWESEVVAIRSRGTEALSFRHVMENKSARHMSFRFGLALRPYNTLMLGHINSIQYERGLWTVNGMNSVWLENAPHRAVVSDRHHGDPLARDVFPEGVRALRSRSGIACGQCEWSVELPAGETREIESIVFIGAPPKASAIRSTTLPESLASARESAVKRLREVQSEGMTLQLPDAELNEAFAAIKGHLHVFDDQKHFSPGTFLYHQAWFRDSAFIASAFDHLGWFNRVETKIPGMLKRQTRQGYFRSQNGEWDSNGQAMWSLVSHVRCGGNPESLYRIHPALMKAARWIHRMRRAQNGRPSPHFGLLPAGFSAEHFGPNDHYYWDNLWAIAGLESALWSAHQLNRPEDAAWLKAESDDMRADLLASMEFSFIRTGGMGLPCSPYRSLDTAAIGNLVGVSPLGIFPAQHDWVAKSCDWLWSNNERDGLFFQKIVHTGLNPYLSAQLARAFMALRDPRGFDILKSLLRHATATYTWPEAMHPRTLGGCMGDGDHGWSAAEVLQLIRGLVVEDHAETLRLLPSIPLHWWREGMRLALKDAPTRFGTVDLKVQWGSHSCLIEWHIRRAPHQIPSQAQLVLPTHLDWVLPAMGQRQGQQFLYDIDQPQGRLMLSSKQPESMTGNPMRTAAIIQG
jgi:hypothetical protein